MFACVGSEEAWVNFLPSTFGIKIRNSILPMIGNLSVQNFPCVFQVKQGQTVISMHVNSQNSLFQTTTKLFLLVLYLLMLLIERSLLGLPHTSRLKDCTMNREYSSILAGKLIKCLFHGIKRLNEKSTFHDMFCKASQYASLIPIKNIWILSSGILISSLLGKKRKADLSLKHQLPDFTQLWKRAELSSCLLCWGL